MTTPLFSGSWEDTGVTFFGGAGVPVGSTETWNPADKSATITLSSANTTLTCTNNFGGVRSVGSHSTGKWYLELLVSTMTGNIFDSDFIGLTRTGAAGIITGADSFYLRNDGLLINGGASVGISVNALAGGTIGFALDLTNQKLWIRNSNLSATWTGQNASPSDPATNTNGNDISALFGANAAYVFFNGDNTTTDVVHINQTLSLSPPTGFLPW